MYTYSLTVWFHIAPARRTPKILQVREKFLLLSIEKPQHKQDIETHSFVDSLTMKVLKHLSNC